MAPISNRRILYLGDLDPGGTATHRANALSRIGFEVTHLNPKVCLRKDPFSLRFNFKTGYTFCQRTISLWMKNLEAFRQTYDYIWVDNGETLGPKLVESLRHCSSRILNYNCDDPTGNRDGLRWRMLRKALSAYDLAVVVREESKMEYPRYGAKSILKVWRGADEVAHAPRPITESIQAKWGSEIAFVGTWMPERGPLMLALIKAGLPVAIWGGRWQKAKEWAALRPYWRGPALAGDEYAYAIQCAKINIGLLSKGNRDLHTTRSAEIPSLGALFCAERTSEHIQLYREDEEACFWASAEECIAICRRLLSDDALRDRIARSGRERWLRGEMRNERVAAQVLDCFDFTQ